jgi:hypothetical protein
MALPAWTEWLIAGLTSFGAALAAIGVAFMEGLEHWRYHLIGTGAIFLLLSVVFFALAIRHSILIRRRYRSIHPYGPAFHVGRVSSWQSSRGEKWETDVLSVCFTYAPKDRTETVAKRLGVEFTCKGENVLLPWLHARLPASPEPSLDNPLPEITFDLGLDQWQGACLVIKEPQSDNCYLFNNDSYHHPRGQNPKWKLGPGEYKVVVRITGLKEPERLECTFLNPGQGGSLEVKSFTPPALVPPSADPPRTKAFWRSRRRP